MYRAIIICDKCGIIYPLKAKAAIIARNAAVQKGWSSKDGKDICLSCKIIEKDFVRSVKNIIRGGEKI